MVHSLSEDGTTDPKWINYSVNHASFNLLNKSNSIAFKFLKRAMKKYYRYYYVISKLN